MSGGCTENARYGKTLDYENHTGQNREESEKPHRLGNCEENPPGNRRHRLDMLEEDKCVRWARRAVFKDKRIAHHEEYRTKQKEGDQDKNSGKDQ
eukprot:5033789-Heterocapsa_arctica.AAC.1